MLIRGRRELNTAADETLRAGAKSAITGFSPNALQQRAARCLYTIAESRRRAASLSVTHAQMMLTDLLFMTLVQQDLERAPGVFAIAGRCGKNGLKMTLHLLMQKEPSSLCASLA